MKTFFFMGIAAIAMLIACDKPGSIQGTKDRAVAEQEAANDVENRNLAAKASKMEKDLADKHAFFSAIEGQYQGTVLAGGEVFNMRITFTRSIQPFSGDRVRQLSEIEADIYNLFFNVHIIQWFGEDMATAAGCRIKEVRPGMDTGIIEIKTPDCPNAYTIELNQDDLANRKPGSTPKDLAEKIKSKQISAIDALTGVIQLTTTAQTYNFSVKRVKQVIK